MIFLNTESFMISSVRNEKLDVINKNITLVMILTKGFD